MQIVREDVRRLHNKWGEEREEICERERDGDQSRTGG